VLGTTAAYFQHFRYGEKQALFDRYAGAMADAEKLLIESLG